MHCGTICLMMDSQGEKQRMTQKKDNYYSGPERHRCRSHKSEDSILVLFLRGRRAQLRLKVLGGGQTITMGKASRQVAGRAATRAEGSYQCSVGVLFLKH